MADEIEVTVRTEGVATEFVDLLRKTNTEKPTKKDLADLRKWLKKHPQLWRVGGDLADLAAERLISQHAPQAALREMLRTGKTELENGQGYENAPVLEQLLIKHVVLCWLRLQCVELRRSQMDSFRLSPAQVDHWDGLLSAAQRRYLRASEMLARVRKLARQTPALQVNIAAHGGQQVNMQAVTQGNE